MNVWEVSANFARLDAILEVSMGELTPEAEEAFASCVDESKDALESAGNYRRWLQAQIQTCKDRRAALWATMGTLEKKLMHLDDALVVVLKRLGKPQRFPEFTLSTMTKVGWEFSASVPLFELPEDCLRYKDPELNKQYLTDLKMTGQKLPDGLVALEVVNSSVTFRVPREKKSDENL
jgi:hypothetical protein